MTLRRHETFPRVWRHYILSAPNFMTWAPEMNCSPSFKVPLMRELLQYKSKTKHQPQFLEKYILLSSSTLSPNAPTPSYSVAKQQSFRHKFWNDLWLSVRMPQNLKGWYRLLAIGAFRKTVITVTTALLSLKLDLVIKWDIEMSRYCSCVLITLLAGLDTNF